jgi:hypothetical protein
LRAELAIYQVRSGPGECNEAPLETGSYLAAAPVPVPACYAPLILSGWGRRILPDDAAFELDGRRGVDGVVLDDAHRLDDIGRVTTARGFLDGMVDYARWGCLSAAGHGPLVSGAVLDGVVYISRGPAFILLRI